MQLISLKRSRAGVMLAGPLLALYGVVYLAAQVHFLQVAFRENLGRGVYDQSQYTTETFRQIFTDSYYQGVMVNTVLFGLYVTAICLVLGYPVAYLIVRSRKAGTPLLLLVVSAAFTATVVRALGWRLILGRTGPVNQAMEAVGLVAGPVPLVDNMSGAVIGTSSAVLPFMVLFLIPVIQAIDPQLDEAALGLGASSGRAFYEITIRQTIRGAVGGCALVYAITVAAFTTPALVGGPLAPIMSIVIRAQVNTAQNYPRAAALSVVLALFVLAMVYMVQRVIRGKSASMIES